MFCSQAILHVQLKEVNFRHFKPIQRQAVAFLEAVDLCVDFKPMLEVPSLSVLHVADAYVHVSVTPKTSRSEADPEWPQEGNEPKKRY